MLAGTLIAVLCSVLGVFLVLRRLSLIGDGLAHVTFGSTAIALAFKLYSAASLLVSLPVVLLASLGILKLTEKARLSGDAAIGIVSAVGISAGIMLASVGGGYNVDLLSYLFGNILAVSREEVLIAAGLFCLVMLLLGLFFNDLLAITFNEELARVSGIRTKHDQCRAGDADGPVGGAGHEAGGNHADLLPADPAGCLGTSAGPQFPGLHRAGGPCGLQLGGGRHLRVFCDQPSHQRHDRDAQSAVLRRCLCRTSNSYTWKR